MSVRSLVRHEIVQFLIHLHHSLIIILLLNSGVCSHPVIIPTASLHGPDMLNHLPDGHISLVIRVDLGVHRLEEGVEKKTEEPFFTSNLELGNIRLHVSK